MQIYNKGMRIIGQWGYKHLVGQLLWGNC